MPIRSEATQEGDEGIAEVESFFTFQSIYRKNAF